MGMRPATALDHSFNRIKACRLSLGDIQPGAGHLEVEHLENGCGRHPGQLHPLARHIVGCGPAGPVGTQGQGNPHFLFRDDMHRIGAIAGCINVLAGGQQGTIHINGFFRSQPQAGLFGQSAAGCYAGGHEHHIAFQRRPCGHHS